MSDPNDKLIEAEFALHEWGRRERVTRPLRRARLLTAISGGALAASVVLIAISAAWLSHRPEEPGEAIALAEHQRIVAEAVQRERDARSQIAGLQQALDDETLASGRMQEQLEQVRNALSDQVEETNRLTELAQNLNTQLSNAEQDLQRERDYVADLIRQRDEILAQAEADADAAELQRRRRIIMSDKLAIGLGAYQDAGRDALGLWPGDRLGPGDLAGLQQVAAALDLPARLDRLAQARTDPEVSAIANELAVIFGRIEMADATDPAEIAWLAEVANSDLPDRLRQAIAHGGSVLEPGELSQVGPILIQAHLLLMRVSHAG